ncbi:4-vinyl reductase [Dyella sp.]|uniref:4-vinyl reductase n=1 Tax=Dyella sp. TaxID=1869338 RepID=UPI002B46C2C9|nr:4-vinyl reductase [Dyella sp.]HKT27650.1 4-vinyl reductase [Dyella sp.]
MIELEIQVLSDRREGLVMELGQVIAAHRYALLRQRLTQDRRGAWLSMVVRGPSEQRFALEEMLGSHNRVLSFEAALCDEASAISMAPRSMQPAFTPELRREPEQIVVAPDLEQVEQILPRLTGNFPDIYPWLRVLESSVASPAREPSLFLAGRRAGAWVYKRDYATNAPLNLGDAIRRVAVPAMQQIAQIEQRGVHVHVLNCPLCAPSGQSGCRFYGGYLEGLLGAAVVAGKKVRIRHLSCRSAGAAQCSLEIAH